MDRLDLTLNEISELPDALIGLAPRDIRQAFPEPTLVRLDGRAGAPLFVSVMLHGNETTGFLVLQRLKRWIATHGLPRPMLIFVGNVHAAEQGERHLDDQPDYNRVWAGGDTPEHRLADRVKAAAREAGVFASIDIHNNTGTNPLYACINRLEGGHMQLASLFGPTVVFYDNPPTTQSMAFSGFCPAVTVEAGKPAEPAGVERAFDLVTDALHMHEFRPAGADRAITLYRTVGRMEIAPEAGFAFSESSDAALVFPPRMDRWNFSPLPEGAPMARLNADGLPLRVFDETRRDITEHFLVRRDGEIRLARPATPSMLTLDPGIVRSDCLGYLMEEMEAG